MAVSEISSKLWTIRKKHEKFLNLVKPLIIDSLKLDIYDIDRSLLQNGFNVYFSESGNKFINKPTEGPYSDSFTYPIFDEKLDQYVAFRLFGGKIDYLTSRKLENQFVDSFKRASQIYGIANT